jgi:hypothetical protein
MQSAAEQTFWACIVYTCVILSCDKFTTVKLPNARLTACCILAWLSTYSFFNFKVEYFTFACNCSNQMQMKIFHASLLAYFSAAFENS